MTEDVVLVTLHYRLGVLGFLSFDGRTSDVPGNAGLKYQVMALKWVRENIGAFGGNVNDVTIFGVSAGASSVHIHMLSPMSKGLFHKAILHSGSALNPWNNGVLGTGQILAEALNITDDHPKAIINQLRKLPVDKLFEGQENIFGAFRIHTPWPSSPVIEKQRNEPAFLSSDPIKIIKSGNYSRVPFMVGHTNAESIVDYAFSDYLTGQIHVSPDLYEAVPNDLHVRNGSEEASALETKLREFFFDGKVPTDDDVQKSIKLRSSIWYVYAIYRTIRAHLDSNVFPIFLYEFTADTKLNFIKRLSNVTAKYPGASHADDLTYLFKSVGNPKIGVNTLEWECVGRSVKLWTNFAKYGNPTPEIDSAIAVKWRPVDATFVSWKLERTVYPPVLIRWQMS